MTLPQSISQTTSRALAQAVSQNMSQAVPQSVSKTTAQGLSQTMHQTVSQVRIRPARAGLRMEPPVPFIVERPWGRFIQYVTNEPVTVKVLEVRAGKRLSLQTHLRRSELWIPLGGKVIVERDDEVIQPSIMEPVFLPVGTRHRLTGASDDARVLEISFGYFDESDIIRFEDDFGRA